MTSRSVSLLSTISRSTPTSYPPHHLLTDLHSLLSLLVTDQAHRDIAIRQAELVSYLSSQKTLRSRVKSIPGFWPWTLSRCKTFSQACTSADDWEAMGHLEDMEFVVDPRDYRAFDIVFVSRPRRGSQKKKQSPAMVWSSFTVAISTNFDPHPPPTSHPGP